MAVRFFTIIFFLSLHLIGHSQVVPEGKILSQSFLAASLRNNTGGEEATRNISIYLPPGYDQGTERYPVIYFLHGVATDDKEMLMYIGLKDLMDKAITSGRLRPMLLVLPDSKNRYGGSFYTNSPVIGNWADFIGKDVVTYVDKNFRTIAERRSRGLCGHSMGGNGALKLAMLFADVFSTVYAMSPAVLDWGYDFTVTNKGFKNISEAKSERDILKGYEMSGNFDPQGFFAGVFSAMGRAYSADEKAGFLQAGLPVSYIKDSSVLNLEVIKKWEANFPTNMVNGHLPALKSLAALKIDWGRNEEFSHIPVTALHFSKKLESLGVKHFAEEYIGDHTNMIGGYEGRFYTEVLPFFNSNLAAPKTK
ncbi:MAG: alpha/beta hydrolase-fold protein [Bacteroidota bacterium]|nr:alpha/beta hydrolase-fold protein [Ferruginibacter sp.]